MRGVPALLLLSMNKRVKLAHNYSTRGARSLASTTTGSATCVVAPTLPSNHTPLSPPHGAHRCAWADKDVDYVKYHDEEWGVPVHDDNKLFEFLILEGAQAGLSWLTVLRKREGYHRAFHAFDPAKVALMSDAELEALRENPDIVRNKLKIMSTRGNALAFCEIQKEFGTFDSYLWAYVNSTPVVNQWEDLSAVPTATALSDTISTDLKKRGMKFVGSTIVYAYMQAVGLVDDHVSSCWKRAKRL